LNPRRSSQRRWRALLCTTGLTLALLAGARPAFAQLTLDAAIAAARGASPSLRAAAEAVTAARARERQADILPNPTFSYGREQTTRAGQTNAQDIAQIEQSLELGGQRASRRAAAATRRAVVEARAESERAQLDFDVTRAFILATTADRRAALADEARATFAEAQRINDERLRAGDVSGYAARRLRLEVARYAASRASVELEKRTARITLAALMGLTPTAGDTLTLHTSAPTLGMDLAATDSLATLITSAERSRPELHEAMREIDVALAEARLAARERFPTPTFSAGYKGERVADSLAGSLGGFRGFVAGFSIPFPLFDRRHGAIEAADADARRQRAVAEVVRRRIVAEVAEAAAALRAAEAQRTALAPHLGDDTRLALRAVQASYAEGEITLVEWLDAMRAYQEAESIYVTLQGDVALRRAALARAVGAPLAPSSLPSSPDR
jgi:cobalt-zinc-cadmium efflux system outer membrane protein